MANVAQSGSPGGWGVSSGKGGSQQVPPSVITQKQGTYTDQAGRPISREEAMKLGIINAPGGAAAALQRAGVASGSQGVTPPGSIQAAKASELQAAQVRAAPSVPSGVEAPQIRAYPQITPPMSIYGYRGSMERPSNVGIYGPQQGSIAEQARISQIRESMYTTPYTKKLIGVSEGLQSRFERTVGYGPQSSVPVKLAVGAGSTLTGIPAFIGQAAFVGEASIRRPGEVFTKTLPRGLPIFASQLYEQATTKPAEFTGSLIGMAALGKGVSKLEGFATIKGRPISFVATPERPRLTPVPESLKGLMTREERLNLIKQSEFETAFKPQTTIGKSLEVPSYGRVPESLKGLVTPKERIQQINTENYIRSVQDMPKMRTEMPSFGKVPESLKGLMTREERLTQLRTIQPPQETIKAFRYVPEAPSKGVPSSLMGLMTKEQRLTQLRGGKGISEFFKSEKAVSYIPTFERAKTITQPTRRVQTITESRPKVLESLRTLTTKAPTETKTRILPVLNIKTSPVTTIAKPKLQLIIPTKTKIATRTATKPKTLVRTKVFSPTKTITTTAITTNALVSTLTPTFIEPQPQTQTIVRAAPLIQTKTGFEGQTQTKIPEYPRMPESQIWPIGKKRKKGKRIGRLYTEISSIKSLSDILGTNRTTKKRKKARK